MKKSFLLLLASYLFLLFGCEKDDITNRKGSISVSLKGESNNKKGSLRVSEIITDDFDVSIYNEENGELVIFWESLSAVPDTILLDEGLYTIVAASDSLSLPAFDAPYYKGHVQVSVNDNAHQDIVINCSLQSVKVSVNFSDTVETEFSDYFVRVGVPEGDYLTFLNTDEDRYGYFPEGNLTVFVKLSYLDTEGNVHHLEKSFVLETKKNELHRLHVHANLKRGSNSVKIVVNEEEEVDTHINFDTNDLNKNWTAGEGWETEYGETYQTIQIGEQVWMAQNYRSPYDEYTEDCYWHVLTPEGEEDVFGKLYTWEGAVKFTPEGWRLPTDEDWKILERYLGMNEEEASSVGWRGEGIGTEISVYGSSGFNAPLAAFDESTFGTNSMAFWTATADGENVFYRRLKSDYSTVERGSIAKSSPCFVRFIKE